MTDTSRDRYFQEWDEETRIEWWRAGRRQLNVIIREVNRWTLDGAPPDEATRLFRTIDMALKTFATEDVASGWRDVLHQMMHYVAERSREAAAVQE